MGGLNSPTPLPLGTPVPPCYATATYLIDGDVLKSGVFGAQHLFVVGSIEANTANTGQRRIDPVKSASDHH